MAMNVLSLLLNKAAARGHIGYHPKCEQIKLTHLSFADDIMVFFDGDNRSLEAIMNTLKIFSSMSGLSINPSKTYLIPAGRINSTMLDNASRMGIVIDKLPIRYLGLPLTTKNMRRRDYEPLIDKIRNKFLSWTHCYLSYGGRLQLIKAVIASITNFWQAVFRLPQGCLDCLEKMCSNFLWTGSILKSSGIRIRWKSLCFPFSEGGLGIRSFRETTLVFSLHLIWRLCANTSSLWVSWVQVHLLRQSSFWDVNENTTKGSWIWRKLLKLRPLAEGFIRVDVKNGRRTHFWHDNWLHQGKLWNPNHLQLHSLLGLPRDSRVADNYTTQGWTIRNSRNPQVKHIHDLIKAAPLPSPQAGNDVYLWKADCQTFKKHFSANCTWRVMRVQQQEVHWWKLVWFPYSIPRQSFILWMVMRNCLATCDKMRLWGVSQHCVLCGERNETKEHLFFACSYSFQAWLSLSRNLLHRRISPDWNHTIEVVQSRRYNQVDSLLLRLILQSAVYAIWRERNSRIHHGPPKTFQLLSSQVAKLIKDRIFSSNRNQTLKNKLLQRWATSWDNGRASLIM